MRTANRVGGDAQRHIAGHGGISARFLPLAPGAQLVYARDLAALPFIEQSESAKVNLAYYRG